mmetsp:Transcript_19336/g.32348  ORF Transcript_19336/g.32348 Transcript_19336/m.32348 type:complete len:110 (+) Transcript_19336:1145-1474(+)
MQQGGFVRAAKLWWRAINTWEAAAEVAVMQAVEMKAKATRRIMALSGETSPTICCSGRKGACRLPLDQPSFCLSTSFEPLCHNHLVKAEKGSLKLGHACLCTPDPACLL